MKIANRLVVLAVLCAPALHAQSVLPSVTLPAELDRVLRDYERFWRVGASDSLASLFTIDGKIRSRGTWIEGRAAIADAYGGVGSDLVLRAVDYSQDGETGFIIGAYGYGDSGSTDAGLFVLALERGGDGRWLIAADLDASASR